MLPACFLGVPDLGDVWGVFLTYVTSPWEEPYPDWGDPDLGKAR